MTDQQPGVDVDLMRAAVRLWAAYGAFPGETLRAFVLSGRASRKAWLAAGVDPDAVAAFALGLGR